MEAAFVVCGGSRRGDLPAGGRDLVVQGTRWVLLLLIGIVELVLRKIDAIVTSVS